jgi:hypothetical protein
VEVVVDLDKRLRGLDARGTFGAAQSGVGSAMEKARGLEMRKNSDLMTLLCVNQCKKWSDESSDLPG